MLAKHTAAWWEPGLGMSLGCRQRMRQSTNGQVSVWETVSLPQSGPAGQAPQYPIYIPSINPARNYLQLEDT